MNRSADVAVRGGLTSTPGAVMFASVASLDVEFHQGGLHLPRLALWLDAHRAVAGPERVFVSHAHADHTAPHREVILSEPTARLMNARLGGQRVEHVMPFGEAREFEAAAERFRLTLLPAGHVLGSAMAWIEAGGETLLYTGDFKLRPGLAAERCEPRHADILVMETTFGRPQYRFPPTAAVIEGIVRFCRETLAEGQTPVLLGYSLGKSQELLSRLGDAGLPIALHNQVHKLTAVYEACGLRFPPYDRFAPETAQGKVVVCPPQAATVPWLRHLGPSRVALLSGWAVDAAARFRSKAQAAFPLSDHADFDDLLRLVELVQPRRVLTLHGFAADFARVLRQRGYDARALSEVEQLELGLASHEPPPGGARLLPSHPVSDRNPARQQPRPTGFMASTRADPPATPAGGFDRFALACAQIASLSGKPDKVERLAQYLRAVPSDWLPRVVIWFGGQPFASVENRFLRVGEAALRAALCTVTGVSEDAFRHEFLRHSDTGETAAALWPNPLAPDGLLPVKLIEAGRAVPCPPPPAGNHSPARPGVPGLSLAAVAHGLEAIEAARGPSAKIPPLIRLLGACSAIEAKYLVKIITGDLRIGLKEGFVEEAIALAFEADAAAVRRAGLFCGHAGDVAALARRRELDRAGVVPFRPLKPMLASPESTAAAVWTRMRSEPGASEPLWVEDTYDGIRCQLHKVGTRVALFSGDGEDLTATFPELAEAARGLAGDLILDGEVLAARGDEVLPFADLRKRLGRGLGDWFLGEEVPVAYVAFDLLWRDGTPWLDEPLASRRQQLENLAPLPTLLRPARVTRVGGVTEIEEAFRAARDRRHEGLVVKDPRSAYSPGERGLAWFELKPVLA